MKTKTAAKDHLITEGHWTAESFVGIWLLRRARFLIKTSYCLKVHLWGTEKDENGRSSQNFVLKGEKFLSDLLCILASFYPTNIFCL